MRQHPIVFNDGQAYERAMGSWSQVVGQPFLDWLDPSSGLRWLDVGCGNGAFTELLTQRGNAAEIVGIDPSEAQLTFARCRPHTRSAAFFHGDAMALPFSGGRFDVSIMALVLFFVPDPAKSIFEMKRVTRPGGTVAAYVWDDLNDASPMAPIRAEMKARGVLITRPPRVDISSIETLRELWTDAGLEAIATRSITVDRTFVDFESYWLSVISNASVAPIVRTMRANEIEELKTRLRAAGTDGSRGITYQARANAIRGYVPNIA
jgi:ubiquinone/menaquinone biosynthesis C-methylase UbiE